MSALRSLLTPSAEQHEQQQQQARGILSTSGDTEVLMAAAAAARISVRTSRKPLALLSFSGSPKVVRPRCFFPLSQLLFGRAEYVGRIADHTISIDLSRSLSLINSNHRCSIEFLHYTQTDVETTIIGDYDITRRVFEPLLPSSPDGSSNEPFLVNSYQEPRVLLDVILDEGVGTSFTKRVRERERERERERGVSY